VGVRGCRHWAQLVNTLVAGSMGAAAEHIKANYSMRQGEERREGKENNATAVRLDHRGILYCSFRLTLLLYCRGLATDLQAGEMHQFIPEHSTQS
jgi:glutaminase